MSPTGLGVSTPSYSRWAIDIVRFGLNDSLRLASCWSVEVVNGGAGDRFWVRTPILRTTGFASRSAVDVALGGGLVGDIERLAVDPHELGGERVAGGRREDRLDRPVLAGGERIDLALALDDEPDRDRLDAAGRQAAADLARQQRAERVADEPVDDPAGLLRVDEVAVDVARVGERLADRRLRDLAERHPACLLRGDVGGLGDVPGDRLALAVEVGREVDEIASSWPPCRSR